MTPETFTKALADSERLLNEAMKAAEGRWRSRTFHRDAVAAAQAKAREDYWQRNAAAAQGMGFKIAADYVSTEAQTWLNQLMATEKANDDVY